MTLIWNHAMTSSIRCRLTFAAAMGTASLSTVWAGNLAAQPPGNSARYDIVLKFTGISGHHATAANCADSVSAAGYDMLVGTVTGHETSATDEEIEYTGTLTRTTAMDFCDIKETSPGQYVDCRATLTGDGTMTVSLMVYGEADRGAWLKATVTATNKAVVTGHCAPPEVAEILTDYRGRPSGSGGGGSPDGQPIEDKFSQRSSNPNVTGRGPRFFAGRQARLRVGYYPPDPAQGGWALEVIRQVP